MVAGLGLEELVNNFHCFESVRWLESQDNSTSYSEAAECTLMREWKWVEGEIAIVDPNGVCQRSEFQHS